MDRKLKLFNRRKERVRAKIRLVSQEGRPRLSVFRSNQHIYVQLIDDSQGVTLASASTVEKELRSQFKTGGNKEAAAVVGKLIAERALQKGVDQVVFDRGGYLYHGRVEVLASAAREAGLKF